MKKHGLWQKMPEDPPPEGDDGEEPIEGGG